MYRNRFNLFSEINDQIKNAIFKFKGSADASDLSWQQTPKQVIKS
jgi:hypothetical protein